MDSCKHLILALTLCGLSACGSEDHTAKADSLLFESEKLAQEGKIEDAEIRYAQAEKEAALSENLFALPRTLESKTKMELQNRRYADGEATAGKLLSVYDGLIAQASSDSQKRTLIHDRARALVLDGDINLAAGKPKEALALYEKAATDLNNISAESLIMAGVGEKIGSLKKELGIDNSEPMLDSANAYFVFVQVYHRAKSELDKGHFGEALSKSRDAVACARQIKDEHKLALAEMRAAVCAFLLDNDKDCIKILKELPKKVTMEALKPAEQAEYLSLSALFLADDADAADLITKAAAADRGRTNEILTWVPEWWELHKPNDPSPPQPVKRALKLRKMLHHKSAR